MKISFDIDNTLIPYADEFEVESKSSILNWFASEYLRSGTNDLFKKLEHDKHEVWIYTTSLRPIWKLRLIFAKYGLYPKGFINQQIKQTRLRKYKQTVSKNPNLFNIDLHVDDSEGVRLEGERNGFDTVIVQPNDKNWTTKVIDEVKRKELNLT
jgi:hypothetical protein